MKKLNLVDFKLKLTTDDTSKANLLDKLAGSTQATCHDDPVFIPRDPHSGMATGL